MKKVCKISNKFLWKPALFKNTSICMLSNFYYFLNKFSKKHVEREKCILKSKDFLHTRPRERERERK